MLYWIYAACLVFVVVVLPAVCVSVARGRRDGILFLEIWFFVFVDIPLNILCAIASILG